MNSSFHGELSEKSIGSVIAQIADRRLSGLLRLQQEGCAKAIYFECGAAVFAASDHPAEQLEQKLLLGGLVDGKRIEEARRHSLTPQGLGWNLVDAGLLSQRAMEESIRELATEIILSAFEWRQGDYTFYEDSPLDLGPKLDWPPVSLMLAGARRAAETESCLAAITSSADRLVQIDPEPGSIAAAATLNSTEGFVLSAIASPTAVSEVGDLTGIPEAEALKAVCVLLVLGLLRFDCAPGEADSLAAQYQPDITTPAVAEARIESLNPSNAELEPEKGTQIESSPEAETETSQYPHINVQSDSQLVAQAEAENKTQVLPIAEPLVESCPTLDTIALPQSDESSDSQAQSPDNIISPDSQPSNDLHAQAGARAVHDELPQVNPEASPLSPSSEVQPHTDSQDHSESQDVYEDACELQSTEMHSGGAAAKRTKFAGASVEWIEELVARKLTSIASADYYGVLGVERIATTHAISAVYKEMRETYDSFRSRWPDNKELTQAVDELLGKIEKAYLTLSDSEKRSEYDRPPGAFVRTKPATSTNTKKPSAKQPGVAVGMSATARVSASKTNVTVRTSMLSAPTITREPVIDATTLADENYRRGRARFDRNDFHGAVHFFREAAKLDASKSHYHYYLGVTLSVLAQARHEKHSHAHDKGCHVNCMLGGGLARNPRLRHEAEQHMLKAAELDRVNPEIRLRLARLYREAGMEKKADHYFLETLMLDASNSTALRELGISAPVAAV